MVQHDGKKFVLGPLEAAMKEWRRTEKQRGKWWTSHDETLARAIDAYFGDEPWRKDTNNG